MRNPSDRTPGFTAEASLYKTGEHYRIGRTGILAAPRLPQTISPQVGVFSLDTLGWRRIPNCGPDGILICYPRGGCWCA
jgi:hypothetical protein